MLTNAVSTHLSLETGDLEGEVSLSNVESALKFWSYVSLQLFSENNTQEIFHIVFNPKLKDAVPLY